jgi:hypothetical protein
MYCRIQAIKVDTGGAGFDARWMPPASAATVRISPLARSRM